jgi:5-formyltetrahydrofolate cyclo-ligase
MPFLIDRDKCGYIVGLPAIIDGKIVFKKISQRTKVGKFGIIEPDTDQLVNLSQGEILCLAPLVACTYSGKRLGRGCGYYDRFFASHRNIFKVGVCYKEQIVEELPVEQHDVKLDLIVSC